MAHTPVERLGWKPNPHVGQQRWVPESLKRVSSAAEPGADIGVIVNAMFTTDDQIITANKILLLRSYDKNRDNKLKFYLNIFTQNVILFQDKIWTKKISYDNFPPFMIK